MSVDLSIKLIRPITLSLVLPRVGITLQGILGLSFAPQIVAEDYIDGKRLTLRSEEIDVNSPGILFEIANEPEIAYLVTYSIEHPQLSSEEQGVYAGVSVQSERSPLEYALAAAVGATLARELNVLVNDDMPFYTRALSLSVGEFVNAIKVKRNFSDYRDAAKAFYNALPIVIAENADGLQK